MVRIRLKRIGQRSRPHYRIVVTEGTRSRDGKYIESLGHYNPRDKALVVDKERADLWLARGAQPSATAGRLLRRYAKQKPPDGVTDTPPAPEAEPRVAPASAESSTTPAASEGESNEATG
jgi:small subunit ribosomal protein S16